MLRARATVCSALLLAAVTAVPARAQRLEVGVRIGYSPPTATEFRRTLGDGFVVRSWDGGALSIGALASYWPLAHFGIQGTADLRVTRAYGTFPNGIVSVIAAPPSGTSTTQLIASVRLAARQAVGRRLQLGASLGPAMIRFGDSEFGSGPLLDGFVHRTAYGVAGGVSAAYTVSSRLRLTVSTEDVIYQVRQVPLGPFLNTPAPPDHLAVSVEAPHWHDLTVSAGLSVGIP
jgi:hypothetical protein